MYYSLLTRNINYASKKTTSSLYHTIFVNNCFITQEISYSIYFLKLINTCYAIIGIWGYNVIRFCC